MLMTNIQKVPFGNVAFLKGEFRETNEITVSLGAEYYAQYTAKDAVEVVDRRLKCTCHFIIIF